MLPVIYADLDAVVHVHIGIWVVVAVYMAVLLALDRNRDIPATWEI